MAISAWSSQRQLIAVLLVCTAIAAYAQSLPPDKAGNGAQQSSEVALPPEAISRPITKLQLQAYMEESLMLEATKQVIQQQLDKARSTLPPWFPEPVWLDVKKRVGEVDLISTILPAYQRHFTERDGAIMVLLFQGPTGHALAQATLENRLAAIHQGLRGAAAESAAMKVDRQSHAEELMRQRVAEFTPEERESYRSLGAKHENKAGDGLVLDDEQDVVINAKCNEVLQATLKTHNRELVTAQQAFAATGATKH